MTIASGFVVEDGVVLCTDSLYGGGIKRMGKKIFPLPLNGGAVAFALAGHEAFAARAIEECTHYFDQNPEHQSSIVGIKSTVELALKNFHEQFVFSRPADEREKVRFELLVAMATLTERPCIFSSCETVLTPISGYECLGSGFYVGEHIIETGYSRAMSLDDAVLLGIHATAVAKEYVEGVGGPIQLLWLKNGVVSPFHPLNTSIFTESFVMSYERRSEELLFQAANPKLSDKEFDARTQRFVETTKFIRTHWRERFENASLLEMLMHPGVPANPPSTTADQSHQQPSRESPGASDES
ncbi:MAG TPA: hypothetical protein VK776_16175 [Bryobacteraceae bacterium]|jgi:hypothetical protein|nr:hypothetical protein [Bryobacteraceae bacterium]